MSWKISGLVWELDLTHSQQSALLAMADHAEHDGSKVFPSVARIAWKTGYSQRQVRRVMSELREMKILILVKEANRYRPREYKIDISAGKKKKPFRGDIVSVLEESRDDMVSVLDIATATRHDIATATRDDIATATRTDIAMSPRTIIKDHRTTNELSLNNSKNSFSSQTPWTQVLAEIGSTYYHQKMHQRNSYWHRYWLTTRHGGQRDGKYIVLCENEEQRAWLQDRGKKIAETKLIAVLCVRAEVEFVVSDV